MTTAEEAVTAPLAHSHISVESVAATNHTTPNCPQYKGGQAAGGTGHYNQQQQ